LNKHVFVRILQIINTKNVEIHESSIIYEMKMLESNV